MLRRLSLVAVLVLVVIGTGTTTGTGTAQEKVADAKKDANVTNVTAERLTPKTGAWWFAMTGAEGPCGYARLEVSEAMDGSITIGWELKLALPGSEYEEERTMVLDAERRLSAATFSLAGRPAHAAKRLPSGKWEVASHDRGEEPVVVTMDLPEDAVTGMGFVLAAWMPHEAGSVLVRADINESAGFRREGSVRLRAVGPEAVPVSDETTPAFRVDLVRRDGRSMPIHVNASREILRADWGGGMVMTLRRESSMHLFKKTPPAMAEVPGGPEKLVVRGEFPGTDPATMFARWSTEKEIVRWWPPQAEIGTKVGEKYHLSWPAQNWFLRGRITVYEKNERLGFTWRWHHEPEDASPREVLVEIAAREGGGSVLTITHGTYAADGSDAKERRGHLAGWTQFCGKLMALDK